MIRCRGTAFLPLLTRHEPFSWRDSEMVAAMRPLMRLHYSHSADALDELAVALLPKAALSTPNSARGKKAADAAAAALVTPVRKRAAR